MTSKTVNRQQLFKELNENRKQYKDFHAAVIARFSERQLKKFRGYSRELEQLDDNQIVQITKDPRTLWYFNKVREAAKAVNSLFFVLKNF